MGSFSRYLLLLLCSGILSLPGIASAQIQNQLGQPQQNNSAVGFSSGLNIGFSNDFEKFNYIDPIGLQLASQPNTPSAAVNPKVYVLGPYDMVSMKIEGNFTLNIRGVTVNAEGDLILPQIGDVPVSGLTIAQARDRIDSVIVKDFKNRTHAYLSLEKPRNFQISITGNVPDAGHYQILAMTRLNTVIDSITGAAGGNQGNIQNGQYDLRNILIHHTDGTTTRADMVYYERTGDLSGDPVVHDGDIIEIHKIHEQTPRISISGAVKMPSELSYRKDDSISRLIRMAGGFTARADTSKVVIFHREGGAIDSLSMSLDGSSLDSYKLQPNDRILIPSLPDQKLNYSAWVYGEVNNPGNYPIVEGQTTVEDLVKLAGGIKQDALVQSAYILRNKSALPNQAGNTININRLERTSNQYVDNLKYLEIETKLSEGRISLDADDATQMDAIKVLDGDRLYIPRNNHTVFLFGQVNNPGYYPYQSGLSVNDYIQKAGGLALSADPGRVFIIKAGSKSWYHPGEINLNSGDFIFVDRKPHEVLAEKRLYELQRLAAKRGNIQLILAGVSSITAIITTLIAVKVL